MGGTTHRATQENGPSVVNRTLLWTSASGITTADPQSYGGCLRRWWYEKVGGRESPETDAMRTGTDLHSDVQNHLETGASLTLPLALSGRMFIPTPGSNLAIERPIHFPTRNGVDICGHVDLYNFRQEYIDEERVLQRDPPYSFEVKDWKTTSDFQYAKTAQQLAENIQLVTYAEAGYRFAPDMEHSRLTHVYFRTKGRPESKLVTIRRTREEIALRWDYAESVVRCMSDVARETTAEAVPGNRKSCDAYRGCPHREVCSVHQYNALDSLYNKIAEDFKETHVGLLASNPQMMQPQQTPVDTRAQLAAEEQQMRAQVAQQQQQMPTNPAQLLEACTRLGSYGFGFPSLAGNAAMAYAAAGGQNVAPGFVYQGIMAPPGARRSLHQVQLTEVGHVFQLEGELAAERGTPPQIAQQVVQQTAPPPQYTQYAPAQPQQPVYNGPPQGGNTAGAPGPVYGGILPPGAPESMPHLAMPQQAPAPQNVAQYVPDGNPAGTATFTGAPAEEPKKKGRPKKNQDVAPEAAAPPAAQIAAQAPAPPAAPATQVPPAAASTSPAGLASGIAMEVAAADAAYSCCILVNARFANKATKSLAGYVDYINRELSKRYCVDAQGRPTIQDVRAATKDSPLFCSGWKGAVHEVVCADPPPPDAYHFDTFMDDLNEVVANALRVVAEAKGWTYVRGVR